MAVRRSNPNRYYFSEQIRLSKINAIGGEYILCSHGIVQP
jgi:hypothetical protein